MDFIVHANNESDDQPAPPEYSNQTCSIQNYILPSRLVYIIESHFVGKPKCRFTRIDANLGISVRMFVEYVLIETPKCTRLLYNIMFC